MTNTPLDHSSGEDRAYRAYLIGTDGRITTSIDIEAIKQAKAIEHPGAMELWDPGRIVQRRAGNAHRSAGER